jgi:hypothetical protein
MERSKTSLNGIKTLVFFQNVGRMHWVTYVIFQDLKIIEEFDSMGPSPSGTVLKGLYRWLFLEYQRIGIHLDSSEWKLYPTRRTTPRQRNGYDCGVFSILFALHIGLRLNNDNINQTQIPAIPCQMLLHLLKIAPAKDNNEVLPVRPAIRETNANNPLLLSADSEYNSDERSAHIDGVLDDNVREDDDQNRPDAGMDIADNNNGDDNAAAYDADGGEEDNASSADDNTNAGQEQAGNDEDVDGGQDNDNAGGDNNGDEDAGGDNNNEPCNDNAGNNEDDDGGQCNDQADNDGDACEDGTNADSEDEEENEEGEVNSDEDDANVDASYQEAEDMDQLADSQLTFGSLAGALPPSQVYTGLIADMSRPASNVLSSPVASSAIQDDVLTSPVTSPVVASLSQFLSEDFPGVLKSNSLKPNC